MIFLFSKISNKFKNSFLICPYRFSRFYINYASISTFNCGFISKHRLFVQYKPKTNKKFANFIIFFAHFQNFTKKTFKHKFFKFWSFINLSWGHVGSHTKFGPDRFSRFDVYWIQTYRHPSQNIDERRSLLYR